MTPHKHTWGPDSRCTKCPARKPGRHKGLQISAAAQPKQLPAEPRKPAQAVQKKEPAGDMPLLARPPQTKPDPDRVKRFRERLLISEPQAAEPEPTPVADPEPAPGPAEKTGKATIHYGWGWASEKIVAGLDFAGSLAIDAFTNRTPLDAGELETEELAEVTAEIGKQKAGEVEVPLWLVFLIAASMFIASKYVHAEPKPAPEPKQLQKPEGTPAAASVADTKIPAPARVATNPATPPPASPQKADVAGSAASAFATF